MSRSRSCACPLSSCSWRIPLAISRTSARRPWPLRISGGATGSTMAIARCAGFRLASRARARVSSPSIVRSPARGPLGIVAGFAPRKDGALPITRPSATATVIATWWPPTRQAHGESPPGSPKTANQYSSGSRRGQPGLPPWRSRSPRTVSSAMTARTSRAPRSLIDAVTIKIAASRWGGDMSAIARPLRSPGVKAQTNRSSVSKGKVARARCAGSSPSIHRATASAMSAAGGRAKPGSA